MLNKIIRYFLENRVITILILVLVVVWGISTSPFNWHGGIIPRNPIPVDAIPDIGDNQQIVATEWMGRSPKDIQDQITYPLTTSLLGIPGVKSIRSSSMFGMSFIYIIFDDNIEFYWSRSRILEKLNSLPPRHAARRRTTGVGSGCNRFRTNLLVHVGRTRSGNRKTDRRMECGRAAYHTGLLCQIQPFDRRRNVGSGISRRFCKRVPDRAESGCHAHL